MKTASWILLALVACLMMLFSVGSMTMAYFLDPVNDVIILGTTLQDLALDPAVATALRGRRGTAAALGVAFGTLLLFVIVGPYRNGSRWAWCAILCAVLVYAGVTAVRILALGIWSGADIALIILAIVVVALLLDVKRLTNPV